MALVENAEDAEYTTDPDAFEAQLDASEDPDEVLRMAKFAGKQERGWRRVQEEADRIAEAEAVPNGTPTETPEAGDPERVLALDDEVRAVLMDLWLTDPSSPGVTPRGKWPGVLTAKQRAEGLRLLDEYAEWLMPWGKWAFDVCGGHIEKGVLERAAAELVELWGDCGDDPPTAGELLQAAELWERERDR